MWEVVRESQQAGVDAVRPGVACRDVDRVCRDVINGHGWGDAFLHGTGHGVGLDIHEDPRVSSAADGTLSAGHVVTVEPGVYLPEHGGVRIEDTVVVTDDGCRPVTRTPKEPVLR
jgi:Xaa-Pro aminopeptidase